jgi:hypothetical protein
MRKDCNFLQLSLLESEAGELHISCLMSLENIELFWPSLNLHPDLHNTSSMLVNEAEYSASCKMHHY